MQSEVGDSLLNKQTKAILFSLVAIVFFFLIVFRGLFFQSTYLLKSFGELSVDPEIAFKNNKPSFLEFYAEWCEVCKEMAPKVSALKEEYEKDINFIFLNVDNQKWENYVRKFDVNGIPQVNLFDKEGNLKSTLIGKQEELILKESINHLAREVGSKEEILNREFSTIKEKKKNEITPRSHG